MKPIDLTKILKRYKGWVALTPNHRQVVAQGSSLKDVLGKATKKGILNPSVVKVPSTRSFYVGFASKK